MPFLVQFKPKKQVYINADNQNNKRQQRFVKEKLEKYGVFFMSSNAKLLLAGFG